MKYNVGDRVIVKNISELSRLFGHLNIDKISCIPRNREIIILEINGNNGVNFIGNDGNKHFIYKNMVKCHINEYYLQEIKDEL